MKRLFEVMSAVWVAQRAKPSGRSLRRFGVSNEEDKANCSRAGKASSETRKKLYGNGGLTPSALDRKVRNNGKIKGPATKFSVEWWYGSTGSYKKRAACPRHHVREAVIGGIFQ